METFIIANPVVAKWVCGVLLGFVGILISWIIWFVKRYLDEISETIRNFNQGLEIIKTDQGLIKDRLQRQETVCEMQRKLCPYYHQAVHQFEGGV